MLVSAGTMAALFAFDSGDHAEGNEVAKNQEIHVETPLVDETKEEDAAESEELSALPKTSIIKSNTTVKEKAAQQQIVNEETAVLEAELEDQYLDTENMAEASAADVVAEGFSETALLSLQWPVQGEVILPFSMDQSVYFATLAQYQYNPAMIISVSEGTEVFAAASGVVTEVGKCNEYGHYVTMDLGDGFEITYGQLFDISTEVGEQLDTGDRFAMVAYPSRNYLEEGENLYLKLTQNDVPVDPELYLKK